MRYVACVVAALCVSLLILTFFLPSATNNGAEGQAVTPDVYPETEAEPLPLSEDGIYIEQMFALEDTFYCLLTENDHSYPLYAFDPESGTGVKLCEIRSFGAPIVDDGLLYYTDYDDRLTVMAYDIAQNQFRKVITETEGTRVSVDWVNGDWLAIAMLTCDENEVVQSRGEILYSKSSGQQTALAKEPEATWAFLGGNSDYFVYYTIPEYSLYALELQTGQSVELAPDPAGRGSNKTYLITEDACYFFEDYMLCRAQFSRNSECLKAEPSRTAGDVLAVQEYDGKIYILTCFAGEIRVNVASKSLEFLDSFAFELENPQKVRDFLICEQGILFEEWYAYEWVPVAVGEEAAMPE